MLVNSLYNIVDSFFVAQISEEAMTALSLVYPVQNFINAVGIGFGVGINAVIAFHLGAGDHEKTDQAATQGLVFAVIHGVVMTVCCIAIMPVFLRMFTSSEAVIELGSLHPKRSLNLASAILSLRSPLHSLLPSAWRLRNCSKQ